MNELEKAWELADRTIQAVKRDEVPKGAADAEYRKLLLALLIFEATFEGEQTDE